MGYLLGLAVIFFLLFISALFMTPARGLKRLSSSIDLSLRTIFLEPIKLFFFLVEKGLRNQLANNRDSAKNTSENRVPDYEVDLSVRKGFKLYLNFSFDPTAILKKLLEIPTDQELYEGMAGIEKEFGVDLISYPPQPFSYTFLYLQSENLWLCFDTEGKFMGLQSPWQFSISFPFLAKSKDGCRPERPLLFGHNMDEKMESPAKKYVSRILGSNLSSIDLSLGGVQLLGSGESGRVLFLKKFEAGSGLFARLLSFRTMLFGSSTDFYSKLPAIFDRFLNFGDRLIHRNRRYEEISGGLAPPRYNSQRKPQISTEEVYSSDVESYSWESEFFTVSFRINSSDLAVPREAETLKCDLKNLFDGVDKKVA